MSDSTRGTWGAEDLPTPPTPPTPTAPPTPGSVTPAVAAPHGSTTRRRNLIIAGGVGALAIIGIVAAALTGVFGGPAPATPTATTVTLASPTPTVAPIDRTPISVFADVLPSSVLDLALTAVASQPSLVAADALEGYRLDYSDGAAVTVALDAGQFETPEAATAAYTALVAATPATDGGTVEVDGAVVGNWTASTAADGTGVVTWSNGTAVFQATGPAETAADFYLAFPL